MDKQQQARPPRIVLAFFRWFCRRDYREDIEGDLLECFYTRAAVMGVSKARRLFIRDVAGLFRPGFIHGLKNINHNFFIMKKNEWIKLVAVNVFIVAAILCPFIPGPSNKIVIGLSAMAQSTGFLGLVLVPIGIIWAIMEITRRAKSTGSSHYRIIYALAIIATVISSFIAIIWLIGIFMNAEIFISLVSLALAAYAMKKTVQGIRQLKTRKEIMHVAPFYLLTIPLIALATRVYIVDPASSYSRDIAIQKSERLIKLVEEYKAKTGYYPDNIEELAASSSSKIPRTNVMGILGYRYNKINDHYSISFSQWLELGSLEELVLYDKGELHSLSIGHDAYDYQNDLHRVKGAFANYHTGHENWRYYWLD